MSTTKIPGSFWGQIDHQLARIGNADNPADTFDKVRAILTDKRYTAFDGYGYDSGHSFAENHAFFGGGGGDDPLHNALTQAGWRVIWSEAYYYYVMQHRTTGEKLTYIEGDVYRGDSREEK